MNSVVIPLVSIITPNYNRAHLIGETIKSIKSQTYQNWELIIVDDGSSDNTFKVLEEFLDDNRIRYVDRPLDRLPGGNAARNYGYEISKGEFVKWLDSDDLLAPHSLEKQVNLMQQGDYDVVFSRSRFFKDIMKNGEFIWGEYWSQSFPKNDPFNNYLFGNIKFSTADGLWKKKFIGNHPYKENLKNSQEWLMLIMQLKKEPHYFIDNEVLVYSRMHEDQMHNANKISLYYKHQVLARYYAIEDLSVAKKLTVKSGRYLFKSMMAFALAPVKRRNFNNSFFNLKLVIKSFRKYIYPILKEKKA